MEWGDQNRRGLLGSFAQFGVPVGLVLCTGGMTLLSATMSDDAFNSWGWRVPFLASLVLVAVGLVIRLKILETPMFAKVVEQGKTASAPVASDPAPLAGDPALGRRPVCRADAVLPVHHVRLDLRRGASPLQQDVRAHRGPGGRHRRACGDPVLLASVRHAGQETGLCDRRLIAGLYAFPYFAVLTYGGQALIFIAIVLSMIVHAMMYGPQAALIGESFPTHLRYGGAGLGYQLASVFAGGPAPLVATWLLHETGTPFSISVYIVVAAVITVVCCLALADRSRVNIDDAAVYSRS